MTIAEYFEGLSLEGLVLAGGIFSLFLILLALHIRNGRRWRSIADSEASAAARIRVEKLIAAIEKMTASPKTVSKRAKPLNKGRKFIPTARATKTGMRQRSTL